MPIINYLYTAVLSGYLRKEQWQKWADCIIMNENEIEAWIYEVSIAENVSEVCNAIYYQKMIEPFDNDTRYWEPDIIVGYYYLMYREGEMSLIDLLKRLSDEDDVCSESEIFDKPEMINLLNDIKDGIISDRKIDELLNPMAQKAKLQYDTLLNFQGNA